MNSEDLIAALAADAAPVKRLRPPLLRALGWLLLAALVLLLLGVSHGVRPDLALKLRQPEFVLCLLGALLTGALATLAAFQLSLPDRSRWCCLLPMPPLVLWLSTIGYGCITNWVRVPPDAIQVHIALDCFATLVLTSLPLSFALLVMLRHAAALRLREVTLAGSLAVAAITAAALALFHSHNASAMILMWNFGTAILFLSLGSLFERRLYSWVAPRRLAGK